MSWWQANVLRAYAKYLRQAGTTFSQGYIEQALIDHPAIARKLVQLFESRFDPGQSGTAQVVDDGQGGTLTLVESIEADLAAVESLDQDRILRSLLRLISATLRTNAYRTNDNGNRRTALALKLEPRHIPELPEPRPRFEIWVYSPRVEGVHLRFGLIARGGLRWSDRREDFRTEVLGLVKAQMVKNAVIVPVGAKGGFVAKRLPENKGDRESAAAILAEGVACYRTFISCLLDLTDNYDSFGKVVPPPQTRRYDGDDPYLVVAADKGTATFSDTANAIAIEYGFWLGDAFASGGSQGYDHKAMGITARGAWESVMYHFRELGVNTAKHDFTVVGIGDMSGDVFGNGMLLSDHIRLVAAFDHRHIFLDPNPDAAQSFAERRRMFALPRSSWADYDAKLISEGGGVFSRTLKSIPITPQVRDALGLPHDTTQLTPNELMHAILIAPVDLLWNGGIGTYVKASTEAQVDAGDKANDRSAGGRFCPALQGGRRGRQPRIHPARPDRVRARGWAHQHRRHRQLRRRRHLRPRDQPEDPARSSRRVAGGSAARSATTCSRQWATTSPPHVLRDNYGQNVMLAMTRYMGPAMVTVHARLLQALEDAGRLDRTLSTCPQRAS